MPGKNVQPRGPLVLVKEHLVEEEKTKSGVIIPLAVGNRGILFATVLQIGPGRYLENGGRAKLDDLKVGDTVIIQSKQGMPLSVEDTKTYLLNETDILAIVD